MFDQRPGFGPADQPWGTLGLSLLFVLGGGYWYYSSRSVVALIVVALAIGGCVLAAYLFPATKAEEQALRFGPPTPRAELTRIVMTRLGATPQDLAANRQGIVTPEQITRIMQRPHAQRSIKGISALRWVEGPVTFKSRSTEKNTLPVVVVDGVALSDPQMMFGFFLCFKRTAVYRLYFVEITTIYGLVSAPATYFWLVAGEALGDA